MLENELHIIYQVVPIYVAVSWPNLDWMNYLSLWESLSPDMRRVGELVGVEERFLVRAMRGTIAKQTPKQVRTRTMKTVTCVGKYRIQYRSYNVSVKS